MIGLLPYESMKNLNIIYSTFMTEVLRLIYFWN